MRLKDAIASLQLGRKKEAEIRQLCTVCAARGLDLPEWLVGIRILHRTSA